MIAISRKQLILLLLALGLCIFANAKQFHAHNINEFNSLKIDLKAGNVFETLQKNLFTVNDTISGIKFADNYTRFHYHQFLPPDLKPTL